MRLEMMTVTIDKNRSERIGIEVADVSVVFDDFRGVLVIYGILFPKPSYRFEDTCVEPDILFSFYNGSGSVIYAVPAERFVSFSLNRYGVFSLELPGEKTDVDSISEIRLLPFLSKKNE